MAIASVEVIPYALPFKEPYVTARGTLERREMVLLRVRDEEGVEGLGEAVPLSLRGGATLVDVVAELRAFGERISGRPELDHVRISGMASAMLSDPGSCAVQIALLDLAGRQSGDSRADRDPIACNATLTAGPPDRVADQAGRWAEDGFSTFKLKVGTDGDVEQVGAVRSVLGPEARIRVDANGVWEPSRAGQVLRDLEPFDIEFAEEPASGLPALGEVRAQTSIPIAADESVSSRAQAEEAYREHACDLAGVKLSKVGGPEAAVAIAFALPCVVSSALDGPVGIAAGAWVVNSIRALPDEPRIPGDAGLAHGLATQRLFAETIASVECELRGDRLHLPGGPGLGIEIDESALARHRL